MVKNIPEPRGPVTFVGDSCNELFIKVANHMSAFGRHRTARGLKTIEILNAWLTLTDISKSVVTLKSRDLSAD